VAKKVISANEFVLLSQRGNITARLSSERAGPELAMYDSKGVARITLKVGKDSRISLYDKNGTVQLEMSSRLEKWILKEQPKEVTYVSD